jgi:hypothetical protein
MTANMTFGETELVDKAMAWLREALPSSWTVQQTNRTFAGGNLTEPQTLADGVIDLVAPNGVNATLVVEAKTAFSPRNVERIFADPLARVLRRMNYNVPILVVSEWLSPRTRELLEEQGINFLDLTGNALIRLDNPTVYIRSAGAARAPKQVSRGQVRLRGPKAARVVRLLLDVRPPYGVRDVAAASGVAVSYVSRLLASLDQDALIERTTRGGVESVDIPRLLRRWAEAYDVFMSNETKTFVAPQGARHALGRLAEKSSVGRLAVTGSFAAVRLAPVAAPALLVAYSDDIDGVSQALDLLPTDEGSNVALMRPYEAVVWDRNTVDDGVRYVAPSQIAIDCLTGNGRMPAEGEALIHWIVENEWQWRLPSLANVGPASAES